VGVPAPPGRRKKFYAYNLRGKFVSASQHTNCTPRQSKSQFRTFFGDLEVGMVDLLVLGRLLRASSKKRS